MRNLARIVTARHAYCIHSFNRSKKETARLYQLNKPVRPKQQHEDDLPSVHSGSDDSDWSGIEDGADAVDDEDLELSENSSAPSVLDSDEEQDYERVPRAKRESPKPRDTKEMPRLPIKMTDGRVQDIGSRTVARDASPSEEDDSEEEDLGWEVEASRIEDVTTGARFGRPAVIDVIQIASRKHRVQAAKEQIASLSQEVIADPENNVRLLRPWIARHTTTDSLLSSHSCDAWKHSPAAKSLRKRIRILCQTTRSSASWPSCHK